MASGNSDYKHGTMPIDSQSGTFTGFMDLTVYGGCAIAIMLLLPILVFALNISWLPALLATVVTGVIMGIIFKLKGGWYAGLAALILITLIIAALTALI